MAFQINDGRGSGASAGVTSNGRLQTIGLNGSLAFDASFRRGGAWYFPTNFIEIGNPNENAISWIKYDGNLRLAVGHITLNANIETFFRIYKCPEGMTNGMIGQPVNASNSNRQFPGDFIIGSTNSQFLTSTGELITQVVLNANDTAVELDGLYLASNQTIGITAESTILTSNSPPGTGVSTGDLTITVAATTFAYEVRIADIGIGNVAI